MIEGPEERKWSKQQSEHKNRDSSDKEGQQMILTVFHTIVINTLRVDTGPLNAMRSDVVRSDTWCQIKV